MCLFKEKHQVNNSTTGHSCGRNREAIGECLVWGALGPPPPPVHSLKTVLKSPSSLQFGSKHRSLQLHLEADSQAGSWQPGGGALAEQLTAPSLFVASSPAPPLPGHPRLISLASLFTSAPRYYGSCQLLNLLLLLQNGNNNSPME